MILPFMRQGAWPSPSSAVNAYWECGFLPMAGICAAVIFLFAGMSWAQVITVDTHNGKITTASGTESPVDRRFQQIQPTSVPLSKSELDTKTRLELIRVLESEQGFAMRPFPRGHKGLTLAANGKLEPVGEKYLSMVTEEGLSAKPGERVVLSNLKFEHSRIVFDLNGGPDPKHRFLRHVQIGTATRMGPVVQGDGREPTGARLSLTFPNHVPELTAVQVKALLAPLISFDMKTPIQAFTDTLPSQLKEAILNHHVLVGMSTDMVLFAKGQPEKKSREMEGQTPFEEWIYGKPPTDVEFVRINGNRVIRVEIAKIGETPVIYTKDEVEGLMRSDGTPLMPVDSHTRTVQMGDAERKPDTQSPSAPPSLRNPGEKLPNDDAKVGVMKPVQMPKEKAEERPNATQAKPAEDSSPTAKQPAPSLENKPN